MINPPAWLAEEPRSVDLVHELHRIGFYEPEVKQTKFDRQKKLASRLWFFLGYPIAFVLILLAFIHYLYNKKDVERFYYVTNQLNKFANIF